MSRPREGLRSGTGVTQDDADYSREPSQVAREVAARDGGPYVPYVTKNRSGTPKLPYERTGQRVVWSESLGLWLHL